MYRATVLLFVTAVVGQEEGGTTADANDLPPMPKYEPAVTAAPSPFPDADTFKMELTGLAGELNEKYDQYKNQPEVYAHHAALLHAKHVILEEKRATMILVKDQWKRRCDALDNKWDELKKPFEAKIDAAKEAAEHEAEKKYGPQIEAAKHHTEVQRTAITAKYSAQKSQEAAHLKTLLEAEDADFAAKAQEIKRQAAAARGNAAEARAIAAESTTSPTSHHVLAVGIVALAGFAIAQVSSSKKAPAADEAQYGAL